MRLITAKITVLIILCLNLNAQQPLSIRINIEKDTYNYNTINLGNKGLIVFYEEKQNFSFTKCIFINAYNNLLEKKWSKEIKLPSVMDYARHYYDTSAGKLYILLCRGNNILTNNSFSAKKGNINILSVDINDGKFTEQKNILKQNTILQDFLVVDNKTYLFGNNYPSTALFYANSILCFTLIPAFTGLNPFKIKPVIQYTDLSDAPQKNKYIGNTYFLKSDIENISDKKDLTTIIKNIKNKKKTTLIINQLNNKSDRTETAIINIPADTTIIDVISLSSGDNLFITGSYCRYKRKKIVFNPLYNALSELSLSSEGLFFGKIKNNQSAIIKYYNYSDFKDFFSNIQNKNVKTIKLNKKKINLNYRVLLHKPIVSNNENIVIAETYYPEYHTEYYWNTDIYGRTYREAIDIFDGFRYTHSLIAAFDTAANLLWHNYIDIGNILTKELKERVIVSFDDKNILLAYSNEGKITTKIICKDKIIQQKEVINTDKEFIKDANSGDLVSDMAHWYDNYYISYGYIKNSRASRQIYTTYYVNKLAFE
ncbi:MAG: hypothetical protein KA792_01635 [Bacteroidales bacterium]|nr:hypothetical protein [Bacteroidales bacterium]